MPVERVRERLLPAPLHPRQLRFRLAAWLWLVPWLGRLLRVRFPPPGRFTSLARSGELPGFLGVLRLPPLDLVVSSLAAPVQYGTLLEGSQEHGDKRRFDHQPETLLDVGRHFRCRHFS